MNPFAPYDGVKTTPKDIRKGRSEAEPNWESILRSFNPNTMGNNTTPTFWLGMSMALVDFPPSAVELIDSSVISYDESKSQRTYGADRKVLDGISKNRSCYQDLGNDTGTVYLRSLLMQGICTSLKYSDHQVITEVVEVDGMPVIAESKSVVETTDEETA